MEFAVKTTTYIDTHTHNAKLYCRQTKLMFDKILDNPCHVLHHFVTFAL